MLHIILVHTHSWMRYFVFLVQLPVDASSVSERCWPGPEADGVEEEEEEEEVVELGEFTSACADAACTSRCRSNAPTGAASSSPPPISLLPRKRNGSGVTAAEEATPPRAGVAPLV